MMIIVARSADCCTPELVEIHWNAPCVYVCVRLMACVHVRILYT